MKSKHLFSPGTTFSWCRYRINELPQCFEEEIDLVCCNNVKELITKFGVMNHPSECRLFIDYFKKNLKGVLLPTRNLHPSIPITHSVNLTEMFENIEFFFKEIEICCVRTVSLLKFENYWYGTQTTIKIHQISIFLVSMEQS